MLKHSQVVVEPRTAASLILQTRLDEIERKDARNTDNSSDASIDHLRQQSAAGETDVMNYCW